MFGWRLNEPSRLILKMSRSRCRADWMKEVRMSMRDLGTSVFTTKRKEEDSLHWNLGESWTLRR